MEMEKSIELLGTVVGIILVISVIAGIVCCLAGFSNPFYFIIGVGLIFIKRF